MGEFLQIVPPEVRDESMRIGAPLTAGVGAILANELLKGMGTSGRTVETGYTSYTTSPGYCARTISEALADIIGVRPAVHALHYDSWLKNRGANQYIPTGHESAWELAGKIVVYEPEHSLGDDTYGHVGVLVADEHGNLKVRSNIRWNGKSGVQDIPARLWSGVSGGNGNNFGFSLWDVSGFKAKEK